MMRKEMDEQLYLIDKAIKDMKKYIACGDWINVHHLACVASAHLTRIATSDQCCDSLKKIQRKEK